MTESPFDNYDEARRRFTVDCDALLSDTPGHALAFRCGPCTTCRHCYRETPSEVLGEQLQCDRPEIDSSAGEYGFTCPPGFGCSLWGAGGGSVV